MDKASKEMFTKTMVKKRQGLFSLHEVAHMIDNNKLAWCRLVQTTHKCQRKPGISMTKVHNQISKVGSHQHCKQI